MIKCLIRGTSVPLDTHRAAQERTFSTFCPWVFFACSDLWLWRCIFMSNMLISYCMTSLFEATYCDIFWILLFCVKGIDVGVFSDFKGCDADSSTLRQVTQHYHLRRAFEEISEYRDRYSVSWNSLKISNPITRMSFGIEDSMKLYISWCCNFTFSFQFYPVMMLCLRSA